MDNDEGTRPEDRRTPPRRSRSAASRSPKPKLDRRRFLNSTWKVLGVALVAEAAWTSYDILKPGATTGFGGTVDAGPVSDFLEEGSVTYFLDGRFYVTQYQGGPAGPVSEVPAPRLPGSVLRELGAVRVPLPRQHLQRARRVHQRAGAARHGPLPDLDPERPRDGRHVGGRRGPPARRPPGPEPGAGPVVPRGDGRASRTGSRAERRRDASSRELRLPTIDDARPLDAPLAADGRAPARCPRRSRSPSTRWSSRSRRSDALTAQHAALVTQGHSLWGLNCTSCHGVIGEGVSAPALNSQQFLQNVERQADARTSSRAASRARRCPRGGTSTAVRSPRSRSKRS